MRAHVVTVPITHPEVARRQQNGGRAFTIADRHRAAADWAVRMCVRALVPSVEMDSIVVTRRASGAPLVGVQTAGRFQPLPVHVSLSHAAGYGAAMGWLGPPGYCKAK